MTLQEAIEGLTQERKDHHSFSTDILGKALQLGIEALKHHKKLRDAHPYSNYKILPGETKD